MHRVDGIGWVAHQSLAFHLAVVHTFCDIVLFGADETYAVSR